IPRPRPDAKALARAAAVIGSSRRPLLVAGGGLHYSDATRALRRFAEQTGVPVAETQAGKGALPFDHPSALGAIGATGSAAANAVAREADVVIGVGTRWSDFTTASSSLFACPSVRFVSLNIDRRDALKQSALPLVADATVGPDVLVAAVRGWQADQEYRTSARPQAARGDAVVAAADRPAPPPPPAPSEGIWAVNGATQPRGAAVGAAAG